MCGEREVEGIWGVNSICKRQRVREKPIRSHRLDRSPHYPLPVQEETFPDMNLNDEQLGRFRELLRGLLNIMPGDRTEPADALEELNAMMG